MDEGIGEPVLRKSDEAKGIKGAPFKGFSNHVFSFLTLIIMVSVCLFLPSCSNPVAISGVWVQETPNGEKVLTVSELGDSYNLVCTDGIELNGAIYQNDEYSGFGEAYDFYLETPSVMTSDIKLNETNYKSSGLAYETMYLTTREDVTNDAAMEAETTEDAARILEGNGASDGSKTILDGVWHKRTENDESNLSDDVEGVTSQGSVNSGMGLTDDAEIADMLGDQISISQFVSSGYEALAIEKEGECIPLVYENIDSGKVGDPAELADDYEEISIKEPAFLNFKNNEYDFASLEQLVEDMPIFVLNRNDGERLITTATAVSLDQSRGEVYITQDAPAPCSLDFPIQINGKDCDSLAEMLSELYQYGIYILPYDYSDTASTWVSENPVTVNLKFWSGTVISKDVVTVDKQAWIIPGSLGMKGTYFISGPADELFETTTDGYFVVKIEDLPAGDYLVSTPDGDTPNCLIRIT